MGIIIAGAPAYRFFGAGEEMARAAERGSIVPALVTSVIVVGLTCFALYAWSADGWIRPLPARRPVLAAITGIYLLRGAVLLPQLGIWLLAANPVALRDLVFSAVALLLGLAHLIGLRQRWRALGLRAPALSAA